MFLCSDVLNYVKAKNLQPVTQSVKLPPKVSPAMPTPSPPPQPTVSAVKKPVAAPVSADYTDIELTNMRSVIASRLTMSKVCCSSIPVLVIGAAAAMSLRGLDT